MDRQRAYSFLLVGSGQNLTPLQMRLTSEIQSSCWISPDCKLLKFYLRQFAGVQCWQLQILAIHLGSAAASSGWNSKATLDFSHSNPVFCHLKDGNHEKNQLKT